MRLRITRGAEADLLEAYVRYEEKQAGLGSVFMEEADAAFQRIVERPKLYVEVRPGIRRSVTRTFPHLVFSSADVEAVAILAVIVARQDPEYIHGRLDA